MSKLFDRFEKLVFNTTGRLFASPAVWVSIDGLANYSGDVFFNNPNAKEIVAEAAFQPIDPYMEFLAPAFSGLKQRVDATSPEIVTIQGVSYFVTAVTALFDGNKFRADVQLVNNPYGPKNQ